MRPRNKNIESKKTCPLLVDTCIVEDCALYDEKLSRCAIQVLNYNLYILSRALKEQAANEQA